MPVENIEKPGTKVEGEGLYSLRKAVAGLIDRRNNTNFPGAQPVSFARRHIEELKKQDYYVCEKSDGFRYLLYLTVDDAGNEAQFLIDRKNDYWWIPKDGLHFPIPKDMQGFHVNTLIDGELVLDRLPDGKMQPKYLVFDCMVLDSNSLMNRTLDKRLAYFKERIFDPYKQLLREFPQELPFLHFLVELKEMQLGYGLDMMFHQVLPMLPHGNDGLIFTCRSTEYKFGTDPHILKWKPENENSIDFRLSLDFSLVQPNEHDLSEGVTKPYFDYDDIPTCNLYVFLGDRQEDEWRGTMWLEDGEWEGLKAKQEPLDDRIVECRKDERGRWRYMKFRDDKKQANHISTVESVIESINDRVTKADLLKEAADIRAAWKRRQAEDQSRGRPVETTNQAAGVKRKAQEDHVNGRPSPGPNTTR